MKSDKCFKTLWGSQIHILCVKIDLEVVAFGQNWCKVKEGPQEIM